MINEHLTHVPDPMPWFCYILSMSAYAGGCNALKPLNLAQLTTPQGAMTTPQAASRGMMAPLRLNQAVGCILSPRWDAAPYRRVCDACEGILRPATSRGGELVVGEIGNEEMRRGKSGRGPVLRRPRTRLLEMLTAL